MNRGNSKPIIASIAVAGILYTFFWRMSGGECFLSYPDPTSRLSLFFNQFMPALIAIAVSAGLVSGAISGNGQLKEPSLRGAVAAVLFGIISFPFTIIVLGPATNLGYNSKSFSTVGLCCLEIFILAFIGAIGSALYAAFAAVSASFGEWLCRKSKGLTIVAILLACAVSIQVFWFSL